MAADETTRESPINDPYFATILFRAVILPMHSYTHANF